MNTDSTNNCGACRWWAPLARQKFIGVCGHRENAGVSTDRVDTCFDFDAKEQPEEKAE